MPDSTACVQRNARLQINSQRSIELGFREIVDVDDRADTRIIHEHVDKTEAMCHLVNHRIDVICNRNVSAYRDRYDLRRVQFPATTSAASFSRCR